MSETSERLMVATMLPEMCVGEVFDEWPRHMTILPWFQFPTHEWEAFDERATELLVENSQFRVLGLGEDYFGENNDKRVARLGLGGFAIHAGLYALAKNLGTIESEQYVGLDWKPHISIDAKADLDELHSIQLDNITVVKKRHKTDDKIVKAVYRWSRHE